MSRPVQPPPAVGTIDADKDHQYAELVKDAAAFRQIGQAGWTLVRTSELRELEALLAGLLAQCKAAVKEVMPDATPATLNEATAERR